MTTETIDKERETQKAIQREKTQALIRALQEWKADESGYDEAVWPQLKKALEENHDSDRKLFRD